MGPIDPVMRRISLATVTAGLAILGLAAWLGYGIHRDELYFIDCGNHLDFGYVDHSLLLPLLARLLGGKLLLMQFAVILAVAGIALAGGQWARRLGGSSAHQYMAALMFVSLPGVLGGAGTFGTVIFEHLAAAWLGVAVLGWMRDRGPSDRYRLQAAAAFVGLCKPTGLFLCAAYAVVLVMQNRQDFAVAKRLMVSAGLGALPFLWWQWANGFPILEFAAAQRQERSSLPVYLVMALMMLGPFVLVAVISKGKPLARSWPLWFTLAGIGLFAVLQGKPYYGVPFLFPLVAQSAMTVRPGRGWTVFGVVSTLIGIGLLLPVWPPSQLGSAYFPLQDSSRERVGWKEWVATVEKLAEERGAKFALVSNYGRAGALRHLGTGAVTPICGHNQNALWPNYDLQSQTAVVVGYSEKWLRERFELVEYVGKLENRWGVPNEEQGREIWLVQNRDPRVDLRADIRHFD